MIPLLTDVLPPVPAVIRPMDGTANTSNTSMAIDKDAVLISLGTKKLRVSMSPRKSTRVALRRRRTRRVALRRRRTRRVALRRRRTRRVALRRRRTRRVALRRRLRTYASRRRRFNRASLRRRRTRRVALRRRLRTYTSRRRRTRRYSYRRRFNRVSYRRSSRRLSLRRRLRAYSARRSSQRFSNPLPGRVVTSGYGYRRYPRRGMHHGVDLTAPRGTPIKASSPGIVSYTGYKGGYGYTVEIKHGNGISTKYAHMSRILVGRGRYVGKGTTIGRVGSTGFSTGPHLHFEVKVNNYPVNPYRYVRRF